MTAQTHLSSVEPSFGETPRISTRKGSMLVSSLRPGDCLHVGLDGVHYVVTVNSKKQRRIVLWCSYDSQEEPFEWSYLGMQDKFVGRCLRRPWHRFLPKSLRKRVCPYSPLK